MASYLTDSIATTRTLSNRLSATTANGTPLRPIDVCVINQLIVEWQDDWTVH